MDLSTLLALVTGIGGLTLSVFSFAAMRRMRNAEALAKETEAKSLEDTITERVLKRADSEIVAQAKKIEELQAALLVEQAARNSDKVQHEARHDALRMELQAEREARESDRVSHDKEIAEMRDELTDLRMGVGILTAQLIEVGRTPRWKPRNSDAAQTKPATVFKR